MGLQYTRTRGGSVGGAPYFAMAKDLKSIIEQELTVAGEEGKDEARRVVETAGTGKPWTQSFGQAGRTSGGQGRVDSGDMRDALDFRVFRGQGVGLDVGWINIYEKYFGYQDEGFSATGFRRPRLDGNDAVVGMGLIAHLKVFMRGRVDEAMDRAIERIVDAL